MNHRQAEKQKRLFYSGIDKVERREKVTDQEREAILKLIDSSPQHRGRMNRAILNAITEQAKEETTNATAKIHDLRSV